MRGVSLSIILLLTIALVGCADPNVSPIAMKFGESNALVMGGNMRMVTERPRPIPGEGVLPTVCTEPSPDVAIAFGRTLALQAAVNNPNGIGGSGSLNAASTEEVTALAGRTAGVLALRDGLYAACQAYVNGILGHSAYAIIMSQYGNLLVALTGAGKDGVGWTVTPEHNAQAALLVACISEHDPTRLGHSHPGPKGDVVVQPNRLLNVHFCNRFLNRIVSGHPPGAAGKKPRTAAAETPATPKAVVIEKTASTKTTSSYDGAAK